LPSRPRHREQAETDRIEQLHGVTEPLDVAVPEERDQSSENRHRQVTPVGERRRRGSADERIAADAADSRRGEREHELAEHVGLLAHAQGRATDRERKRTHEVQRQNRGASDHPSSECAHVIRNAPNVGGQYLYRVPEGWTMAPDLRVLAHSGATEEFLIHRGCRCHASVFVA
jgi:hypothetical protein